jgi:hypothetical protein
MEPTTVTVITDGEVTVAGYRDGDALLVDEADLLTATGWELKPEGLCQGDLCVPVRDRSALVRAGKLVLGGLAAAVRRPFAAEPAAGIAVLGTSAADAGAALSSLRAPDFTLPEMSGSEVSLRDFAGKKRLLVAFASW